MSKTLADNNNKKSQNHKNHEEKITVEKLSISARRKLVHSLDLQGFSNQEIAKQLNVSLSTIEKDLNEMKQNIREWFSQLGSEERYLAFIDAVIHIDLSTKQLWKMAREEKDQKEKIKLLDQITNNAVKKAGLFKTSEAYLTTYYFKQKDTSPREIAREELRDML
ncbi:MAG: ECF-type sigma factor [Nitrosarchaeum sp.]|uniref:ECF-type sigma factor n=1 Tax=Nitrosarchaeum sp. TaxID=2026886 RepID=UPI002DF1F670|nr:ECF-type sigma factor [Nitrosarchaeum sp.]